jgi:hypothetical protein
MNTKQQHPSQPLPLPRGTGSVQMRGASYWMIYGNELGQRIQENCNTLDRREAERILIQRALRVLELRMERLRGLADDAKTQGQAQARLGVRTRGANRPDVQTALSNRKTNTKGASL